MLFETYFVGFASPYAFKIYHFMAWIGISAGMHAVPSRQDMNSLSKLATTPKTQFITNLLKLIFEFFNAETIGFFLSLTYSMLVGVALPYYLFK
jgi:hypothetical protein